MRHFEKGEKIRCGEVMWQCIVCDDDIAVFGEMTQECAEGHKTIHTNLFTVSQKVQDGFEFDDFLGKDEHTGVYIFEGDEYSTDQDDNLYLKSK